MSAVLAHSNILEGPPVLKRASLATAFNRAAKGLFPQNPHAHGPTLIAEAYIAQDVLKQIGAILSNNLRGSDFEVGPEKDLDRALTKVSKKGADLSVNCDFSRARHFTTIPQMKKMIDLFGTRGPVTLQNGDKELKIHVVDVENTLSNPSSKKGGLRNLSTKLLIPITLDSGEETYHVCELQFILKSMRKDWEASHGKYCEVRKQLDRIQKLDELMDGLDTNSGTAYRRLEAERSAAHRNMTAAERERLATNNKNARKAGADDLIGYQPCRNNNTGNVALEDQKPYIQLVVA